MKAIHKKTNSEHKVVEIIGDRVVLESLATGKTKRLDYGLFKEQYQLVEGKVEVPKSPPTVEEEIEEAKERAEEVLSEGKQKPSTIVRIPLGEEEPPKQKPKTSSQKPAKAPQKGATVTLKEICQELNMDPAKARRTLRKAEDIGKQGKWEWSDPKEISRVKSLLK